MAKKKEESQSEGALEAKLYDKAFRDIAKKLGTTPEQLDAIEKAKKETNKRNEQMVIYNLPFPVWVNGREYRGQGKAPRRLAHMIMKLAGERQRRLVEEKISHKWEVKTLLGGVVTSKLVSATDAGGTEVGYK